MSGEISEFRVRVTLTSALPYTHAHTHIHTHSHTQLKHTAFVTETELCALKVRQGSGETVCPISPAYLDFICLKSDLL